MHHRLDDLDWLNLGATGWYKASVTLDKNDSAENPASTKHDIYGPAVVTYEKAPDGGITVSTEEVPA